MSTTAQPVIAVAGTVGDFETSQDWIELLVKVPSSAGGSSSLLLNGSIFALFPDDTIRMLVAPRTKIQLRTTSGTQIEFSCVRTELPWIAAIQQIADCLSSMAPTPTRSQASSRSGGN